MTVKLMRILACFGLLPSLRSSVARLARDNRGNSAIEFAMIVPLMLVMFFGTIEFSSAVAVDRKLSLVSQGLADLVSRYATVTDTDITNFFKIGDAMLTPYSSTLLKTTITEIYIDPSSGVGRSQWSNGDAPYADKATVAVPANLIARDASNKVIAGQYLILAETSYVYKPTIGYVMGIGGVSLSDKMYMRPRLASCVLYNTTTGSCPTK
jgi:Flp pilus assembly protein TadG